MKLFGQLIKTTLNIVTLPITLSVKIMQDISDPYTQEFGEHTKELFEKIKEEAEEE